MVDSVQRFAVAIRSTSTPGVVMSTRNIESPRLPVDAGSVRAIVQHQSALCAPVTKTFSPSSTKPVSPRVVATVSMFDRSLPAPASVYAMHAFTVPAHAARTTVSRCPVEPNVATVGATRTAAVSMSGASWYAAS